MDEIQIRFEKTVLPHVDAAYNLARWIVRDASAAEDVVQESLLRALRFFGGCRGTNVRSWLLTIVRHSCFAWLKSNQPAGEHYLSPEEIDIDANDCETALNPEAQAIRTGEATMLHEAISALPLVFREAIIMRELEDLSYREIAEIADVPIGTVMSRLARGRRLLLQSLGAISRAAEREDAR